MKLKEFQAIIYESSLFDRVLYYTGSLFFLILGINFFYEVWVNPDKYELHKLKYPSFLLAILLVFVSIWLIFYVKNKYKISHIESRLPLEEKENIILSLLSEYNQPRPKFSRDYYTIWIPGNWYTANRIVLINLDEYQFSISVQNVLQENKTLVDIGSSDKIRRKITKSIISLSGG